MLKCLVWADHTYRYTVTVVWSVGNCVCFHVNSTRFWLINLQSVGCKDSLQPLFLIKTRILPTNCQFPLQPSATIIKQNKINTLIRLWPQNDIHIRTHNAKSCTELSDLCQKMHRNNYLRGKILPFRQNISKHGFNSLQQTTHAQEGHKTTLMRISDLPSACWVI